MWMEISSFTALRSEIGALIARCTCVLPRRWKLFSFHDSFEFRNFRIRSADSRVWPPIRNESTSIGISIPELTITKSDCHIGTTIKSTRLKNASLETGIWLPSWKPDFTASTFNDAPFPYLARYLSETDGPLRIFSNLFFLTRHVSWWRNWNINALFSQHRSRFKLLASDFCRRNN